MEKYKRVEKQKVSEEIKENEIRVTTQGKMRNYISYATNLFKEKGHASIVLKAMGRAINKTVTIAEIIKRRIPNLHQQTTIDSTDIVDVWEPIEEGLDRLETTRHVSSIQILLSTEKLDPDLVGYQEPLPEDQVKPSNFNPGRRRGGRGRGRGGRGRGSRGRGGRGRRFSDQNQESDHEQQQQQPQQHQQQQESPHETKEKQETAKDNNNDNREYGPYGRGRRGGGRLGRGRRGGRPGSRGIRGGRRGRGRGFGGNRDRRPPRLRSEREGPNDSAE